MFLYVAKENLLIGYAINAIKKNRRNTTILNTLLLYMQLLIYFFLNIKKKTLFTTHWQNWACAKLIPPMGKNSITLHLLMVSAPHPANHHNNALSIHENRWQNTLHTSIIRERAHVRSKTARKRRAFATYCKPSTYIFLQIFCWKIDTYSVAIRYQSWQD